MQRLYGICFFIAESQFVLGVLLLFAAAVIRSVSRDVPYAIRHDQRRPLWWWLAVVGWWLVAAALAGMVILFFSFYPVRRA